MNRDVSNRVALIAAALVGVGALASSGIVFATRLAGLPSVPLVFILQDPIGWALGAHMHPLFLLGMLLALILLVGGTWLFVRLIARAAMPGKAAAVFFGTWGAIIVAGWIAGIVRAPLALVAFQIPAERAEILMSQFYQLSTTGGMWALGWGWVAALVAALVHKSGSSTVRVDAPVSAPYAGEGMYPPPIAETPAAAPAAAPGSTAADTPPTAPTA